jgi:hypothetical protein
MLKKKLMKGVMIVVLFLVVPILIGNITARILEITNPPPAFPLAKSLERTRAITRTAIGVIGVYYVLVISAWIILRHQKRKSSSLLKK